MTEKFTTNTDKPLAVFLTGVQCRKITYVENTNDYK